MADPSRRRILDILKAKPGTTVGELGAQFVFSRFALMKHLRLLEEVGLVVRRREGKTKRLYLNAVPIQTIHDRWISRYSALWAAQLTSLKYQLEGEESALPAATQGQHVHVVHIRTTPERLWEALTNPEQNQAVLLRHRSVVGFQGRLIAGVSPDRAGRYARERHRREGARGGSPPAAGSHLRVHHGRG